MRRIDLAIGIVIVAAVLLSTVGVATYERAAPATTTFDVLWSTETAPLQASLPSRMGAGNTEGSLIVDLDNLTEASLTVTATASGAARLSAVAVSVTVRAPGLPDKTASGSIPMTGANSATINIPIPVRALPNATEVTAKDQAAGEQVLLGNHSSTLGKGSWRIIVQFTPGTSAPETFGASVRGEAKTYAAALAPKTPTTSK